MCSESEGCRYARPCDRGRNDPAAVDRFFPHPIYASHGWVSVINPQARIACEGWDAFAGNFEFDKDSERGTLAWFDVRRRAQRPARAQPQSSALLALPTRRGTGGTSTSLPRISPGVMTAPSR
jgi:hypothetical protein